MASELQKKTQSLCTAQDMREATQMVMKPYANWEEYLTPTPLSVAILGELVNMSSNTDFSINKNPPKGGFQYIKYPDSFRACLMQVCNTGWWAFNEAHKSMDQIRLHTASVPDYMAAAVKILFTGSDAVVQAHLPDQLDAIQDIADNCVKLATAAEDKFAEGIHVVQELLEACLNAEHSYEEEVKEIQLKLVEAKLKEESSREFNKKCKKAMKRLEEELKESKDNYKKAMDSLPSGYEMIGMDFIRGLSGTVTGLMNGMSSILINPFQQDAAYRKGEDDAADMIDEIGIYCRSGEILDCTDFIGKYIQENTINWQSLYDPKEKKTVTIFAANQFKRIQKILNESPECNSKDKALLICQLGINICQKLAEHAPLGGCSVEKTNEIISKFQELKQSALAFDSASKSATKSPSLIGNPPMMNNAISKMSVSQKDSENAHFRIEQTRAQLDKARDQYDKCVDSMEKNQKELTDILVTIRRCNAKEIDFNKTIEMLMKVMDAMGRVKAQWEKMVRFFQMVSSIVKVRLSKNLNNFVTHGRKTQELNYDDKLFSRDLIYKQAFQASNIAGLVHMISETYTEVSNKYLMDRVSSLGKLMAMDKSKPEFQTELEQLRLGCDEAQRGILDRVRKNKKDFERTANARLERIEGELLAILPPAPPQETRAIQEAAREAVQEGFSEADMAAYI